ncbi:LysR substrate-binding domain-containing protein [Paenibacillus peoriae]|uniref:LysR family transcriptional regulator n=1 Tax=Paenibacillus peoriae TaxID=59893 RepID=UPI00026C57A6|nr:LysR substrate-binding domain-containing protein [Paenibacillus peoriae]MEC0179980.1 LysR substrate-binding domain-containing protein [Paenibacillus peoriae]
MEHRLLTYFLMVCEELHFTRAAERLSISQPTLSHQIQLLEHQLGMPLFTRIGKKVYLSEAGHILRSHALNAFHELDQARAAIEELRGMKRGCLRIGCAGNHLLLPAIAAFHRQYPEIELSVQELATEEVKKELLTNRIDLGIVYLPLDHEQLESIELFEDELQLVVAAGHPLAGADAVPLAELQAHPFAMLQPKFLVRQFFDQYCEHAGFHAKPILELSTLESLLQIAITGVGAAVLPRSYLQTVNQPAITKIRLRDPAPTRKIGLVYRKTSYLSTAMKTFITQITMQ